jgi:uncharacterized protein (DUF2342 family)
MGDLHFVGFKDDRIHIARRVFGEPDFYHRHWDLRAVSMVLPGDVAVFADGDEHTTPKLQAFDDSQTQ